MPVGAAVGRDAAPTRTIADMLPLIPADLLRALGLILVPVAAVHAGWPSAAAMLLVFGSQWLTRWLAPGGVLDWAAQAVLLLAGWLSVIGLYPRVPSLDLLVHAAASAVVACLTALVVGAWLRRRGTEAGQAVALLGPGLAGLGIAAAAVALGVVWELAEWWGHTAVTPEIGVGYTDTIGDLAADLVGAGIGAALAVRRERTR